MKTVDRVLFFLSGLAACNAFYAFDAGLDGWGVGTLIVAVLAWVSGAT